MQDVWRVGALQRFVFPLAPALEDPPKCRLRAAARRDWTPCAATRATLDLPRISRDARRRCEAAVSGNMSYLSAGTFPATPLGGHLIIPAR